MAASASKLDSLILGEIARHGRNFVSLDEDRAWLSELTPDPALQLARMKRRGSLAPVARGRYVVLPPGLSPSTKGIPRGTLLAAAFAGSNQYYLGYLSALVDHHLTDEHSRTIYLAVWGEPPRIARLGDEKVRMTQIKSERKRFGAERVRAVGKTFYWRSDLERTLLDTLDRPELCGGPETWVRAWSRAFRLRREPADVLRLSEYAERWGGTVAARCAYWLRDVGHAREARQILRAIGAPLGGRRLLDRSQTFGEGDWIRDRETGLTVNMPEQLVAGWLAYEK
jgi:predicted transcriptional regulator of viral defense system